MPREAATQAGQERLTPTNNANVRQFIKVTQKLMADKRNVSIHLVQLTQPTAGRGCGFVLGRLELKGVGAVKSGTLVCFGPTFDKAESAVNWSRKRKLGFAESIEIKPARKAA